jgi:hypothetical protein
MCNSILRAQLSTLQSEKPNEKYSQCYAPRKRTITVMGVYTLCTAYIQNPITDVFPTGGLPESHNIN